MPIAMLKDTCDAIGSDAAVCDSRSLLLDRFAEPMAKDNGDATPRKAWFKSLLGKKTVPAPSATFWLPAAAVRIHARLMSRLMVNMGGGVMENANLQLDRYGLPVIPGSAVKGCARRMALQALHDWIVWQENSGSTERPSADEDACAPCCEAFANPAAMLAAIARIFGWAEKDWEAGSKEGRYCSDFGWACGGAWEAVWNEACQCLARENSWQIPALQPWRCLPHFAGTIAFLPAHPGSDPGLELDVLTPHHKDYYEGTRQVATDDEDPVPVFFPAVAPQKETDSFTFPLIPLRRAGRGDLDHAQRWLSQGLELLGLGAKTNAGYGWFEVIPEGKLEEIANQQMAAASDYANALIFQNAVLNLLTNPGQYQKLQMEIPKLHKPENAQWLNILETYLASPAGKEARQKLKGKTWFPFLTSPNPPA